MGYVQQQQHQQQSQQEEQREAAAVTTTNSTQINCAHYKRKIVASLSLSLLTALPDATRNYEMCTCVCVCVHLYSLLLYLRICCLSRRTYLHCLLWQQRAE